MAQELNAERERLAELYRGFGDEELLNLHADSAQLTDGAQQALAAEMMQRGLVGAVGLSEPTTEIARPLRSFEAGSEDRAGPSDYALGWTRACKGL